MRKFLILFLIAFLLLVKFSTSQSVIVTLNLNVTEVEWNETVGANGSAQYANGTAFVGEIRVKIDDATACTASANGSYNCSFNAPLEVNTFSVRAYAIEDGSQVGSSNEVKLEVYYFYGSKKVTRNVAVLGFPMLMQHPTGRIGIVRVNLKVWR